ncbi:hypothetical protein ES706_03545 [subsurface metagenome]
MAIKKKNSKEIINRIEKLNFEFKIWFKYNNQNILGDGWSKLLQTIKENKGKSLLKASEICHYSYKYAWSILKRIEVRTGIPAVSIGRGGHGGGGWTKLNKWGEILLNYYMEFKSFAQKSLKNYFVELKKVIN